MTTSLDMIRGRSNIVTLTNNSGGALAAGDVCIQDTSADENVTTTTSAASLLKVLVAAESIAGGATGRFYESGYCPLVNVSASATRGYFLFTHTVAKQAATNATYSAGAFGKILKAGTSPSAIIYSATAQVVGGGTIGGSSGSTDNAVIRADGTGGVTVQSSLATVDDSGTVNIPTGQTYNINGSPHTHAASGASNNVMFFVDEATVTVGNAFVATVDGNQRYSWWQYQNAAANGDTWTKPIFIAAGTYTIYLLGVSGTQRGIQDVYIDLTKVGSLDWYAGSTTYHVVKTIASVTIATDGAHTFKSVMNGKNGSSSDYQLLLTKVWIE